MCLTLVNYVATGQNLLTNGDFESGFDDWENVLDETAVGEFTLETSDIYKGSGAMKLVYTQLGANDWSAQSMHSAWASVAGTEYRMTLYAKAAVAGTSIRAIQQLNQYDAMDFTLSTEWTQYEWVFSANENNQQLKIHFIETGTIYIDNIVIEEYNVTYPNDNTLEVNTNVRYQTMQGFGGALCFYENWVYAHPNKEELYQLAFEDLGINLLRLRNKYQYETNFTAYDPEFVQKGEEYSDKDFKVLMCSWSPPANLKSNGNVNNGTLAQVNGEYVYQEFGDYWRDALEAYRAIGVDPDWIGIQNEPDFLTDSWESCKFTPTETEEYPGYDQALDAVYSAINTIDNPPLIVGAEELGIGYNNFNNYSDPVKDNAALWAYGYHLYHGGDPELPDSYNTSFNNIAANYSDRPNIMTEYEHFEAGWFKTAWLVSNNVSVGNASGYFYWDLIWPGSGLINIDNPWDVANWSNDKGYTVEPHYYAFKHFSKFIDVGYERVECVNTNDAIKSLVFISPDGTEVVMVLLNVAGHTVSTNVVPAGWTGEASTIYQSVEGNYFQYLGSVDASGLMDLPSESVTTIVYDGSITIEPVITVVPTTLPLQQGNSYQLTASVTPNDGTNYAISWSSSNTSTATVNSDGVVAAILEGTATISATLTSGSTASCEVTVLPGSVSYYTLSYTVSGSGSVSVDPTGLLYEAGTDVTLTATPDEGWQFESWSGDVSSTSSSVTIAMNSDMELVANFSGIPEGCDSYDLISLPFSHTGSGTYCWIAQGTIDNVNSWDCETLIINGVDYCGVWSNQIEPVEGDKYYIQYTSSVAWSHVEINGTNSTGETYTLTVTTSEGGTVSPESGTYTPGTVVDLVAVPETDFAFVEWGGDVSGTEPEISIAMDDNKSVTATFKHIMADPALSVTIVGEGAVSPASGIYQLDEVIALTATPGEGNHFVSWSGNASGTDNPLTITMDSDKSITATFAPDGGTPCEGAVTVSVPINQNGVGEYCWFTADDIACVNSWNMDVVEINNVDYTNTWNSSMPAKIDGGYYIYCSGPYGWSHFEAAVLKSAGTESMLSSVYPNPFTDKLIIQLKNSQEIIKLSVLDALGRVVHAFDANSFSDEIILEKDLGPGTYYLRIARDQSIETIKIIKE